MTEQLFQYVVIAHPTEEERKSGKRSRIVVPLSEPMLATGEQEVVMRASREIPAADLTRADRLEVAVRPF